MRIDRLFLSGVAVLATISCGGDDGMMTGPTRMGGGSNRAQLMAVSPQGGAAGVATSSPIVVQFGVAMGAGMEQYIDLHLGDLSGPLVPMSCSWSGDRTTLTCRPETSLRPHTTYVVHVGGGLMSLDGRHIDDSQFGSMMGGHWIMGGMISGSHAGAPWAALGPGWRNDNSYGMEFSFSTR